MDSAENLSEGGYGRGLLSPDHENAPSFHFANEKANPDGRRKSSITVRRRPHVPKWHETVPDSPRDSFENIKHKLSAIPGPFEMNNNSMPTTDLYSTPVGKMGTENEDYCSGLGKSPVVDSGFASNMSSSASKLATPTKSLFTSPNQEKNFVLTQNYYEEMKTTYPSIMEVRRRRRNTNHFRHFLSGQDDGKKRLFETSSQPGFNVFGVRYKLDEVIPWAVLGFVLICAIFTVTTLTSGLRRVHDDTVPASNGKYRSIQFAHDQLTKEEGKFQVLDEDGNPLGGKRAAIQFAFNKRNNGGDKVDLQNHFDTLDLFKTIDDMAEEKDTASVPEQPEEMSEQARQERVVKAIASFGAPFSTSQVMTEQGKRDKLLKEIASSVQHASRKKRGAGAKKSKNVHPFVAFKGSDTKKKNSQKDQRGVVEKNNFRFR